MPKSMPSGSNAPLTREEAIQRYERLRAQLKEGLERKRQTDRDLTDLESQIYLYEGSYLMTTALSGGNVIRGFDSFVKAGAGLAPTSRAATNAQTPATEDRMFSTSSATYQRSLALKASESALSSDPKTNEPKGHPSSGSNASGYKLKRKNDDLSKKA